MGNAISDEALVGLAVALAAVVVLGCRSATPQPSYRHLAVQILDAAIGQRTLMRRTN
jgi:hypothetical protein